MDKRGVDIVFKADMSMLALVLILALAQCTEAASKLANYWVDQWIAQDTQMQDAMTPKQDLIESFRDAQQLPK